MWTATVAPITTTSTTTTGVIAMMVVGKGWIVTIVGGSIVGALVIRVVVVGAFNEGSIHFEDTIGGTILVTGHQIIALIGRKQFEPFQFSHIWLQTRLGRRKPLAVFVVVVVWRNGQGHGNRGCCLCRCPMACPTASGSTRRRSLIVVTVIIVVIVVIVRWWYNGKVHGFGCHFFIGPILFVVCFVTSLLPHHASGHADTTIVILVGCCGKLLFGNRFLV
jgi:hypothetical protein